MDPIGQARAGTAQRHVYNPMMKIVNIEKKIFNNNACGEH